jgi:hypothetical protein
MTEEKFTPGEWTVHEFYHEFSKQNLYNIYWSKDGEEVAERIYTKADAHLMAESKDLYECVCDALTDLEMPEGMRNHFEAVLKKARGEE